MQSKNGGVRLPGEPLDRPAVLRCLGCDITRAVTTPTAPGCPSCSDEVATAWVQVQELHLNRETGRWVVRENPSPPDA